MSTELVNAVVAVADRLVSLASEDAELRSQIRQLAQAVLEGTAESKDTQTVRSTGEGATASRTDEEQEVASEILMPVRTELSADSPPTLPELTLEQAPPSVEPESPAIPARWMTKPDSDLALIEARCRLKAEGARWAAERRRLMKEGADFSTEIDPKDRDIISKAKALPDCFLWMCHPSGPTPADLKLYENVAGCFEAVADVLCVLKQIEDAPDSYQTAFEESLDLLAEAQSSLRIAIVSIDGPTDSDQAEAFAWLKRTAREGQILIQRYMRSDDLADPARWPDLSSRIDDIDAIVQNIRKQAKQRRKLLGKVRHKLSLIKEDPEDADEHWRILVATVEELLGDGLPPSNRELRELLVPFVESLPDLGDSASGFQLVLREIDRFLATTPTIETTAPSEPTPEVREVARMLNGRSMVLIGGERRPASHQALEEAFGLRELHWVETREHQSIDRFKPYVTRPDVAVVLLAIRWSSHSFGDIIDSCDSYGKPLVRLPGGYNPNQVAAQILDQCSERLRASAGRE